MTEDSERRLQSTAGIKLFFKLADGWQLTDANQQALLGDIDQVCLSELRKHPEEAFLSDDQLDRLGTIINIHASLCAMFDQHNQYLFLTNPQDAEGDFPGQAPLFVMTSSTDGLNKIHDYLDGLREGGFY